MKFSFSPTKLYKYRLYNQFLNQQKKKVENQFELCKISLYYLYSYASIIEIDMVNPKKSHFITYYIESLLIYGQK